MPDFTAIMFGVIAIVDEFSLPLATLIASLGGGPEHPPSFLDAVASHSWYVKDSGAAIE